MNPYQDWSWQSILLKIVTVGQGGRMSYWLVESGQRVKNVSDCHGNAEITCLSQDATYTRLYTGSTSGTVKVRGF